MKHTVLLDFGSTFTKATVVDMNLSEVVFTSKVPSTVAVDASTALEQLYSKIEKEIGSQALAQAEKLATSSAAGGLRMAVIGLTSSLSNLAGKNAAFGAGAKILRSYAGLLTEEDVVELEELDVEIILLLGGYEGGNTSAVMHNVEMLGRMVSRIPVIYAGNSEIIKDVKIKFYLRRKECFVVNNIIPAVGEINSRPAEDLIRNIFLERITNMKGLAKVKGLLDRIVMPTPTAVLKAGELLSKGSGQEPGLGELMVVDIGGATTDIHSYCQLRAHLGAKLIGSPEPYAKRTVEGDLGMRESAGMVIGDIGIWNAASELAVTEERLAQAVGRRVRETEFLPALPGQLVEEQELESRIDDYIARNACRLAARRHAGRLEPSGSNQYRFVQQGKDLAGVKTVIGTGGPLIHSACAKEILAETARTAADERLHCLLPRSERFLLDGDYILYAAGILSESAPSVALTVMKHSLKEL